MNVGQIPDDPKQLKQIISTLIGENRSLIGENRSLIGENVSLKDLIKKLNGDLRAKEMAIAELKRLLFGPKSERQPGDSAKQLALEQLLGAIINEMSDEEEENEENTPPPPVKIKAEKKKKGKRGFPKNLPRKKLICEVDEDELTCKCCGRERVKIGEEISEILDYVPAHYIVTRIIKIKRACGYCKDHVVCGTPPKRIVEGGSYGDGLLVQTIINKYLDHLPLHRQEKIYSRMGVFINRSTMSGWVGIVHEWIEPVLSVMYDEVKKSHCIKTDDTGLPVLFNHGTEKRAKAHRGYLWCYIGDTGHMVFLYTHGRSSKAPEDFLTGFTGNVQCDAGIWYNPLFKNNEALTEIGCWAHIRRYFVKSLPANKKLAQEAIDLIGRLYGVERKAKAEKLSPEELLFLRQQVSAKIIAELDAWLQTNQRRVLPKSPLGVAIAHTINQWPHLIRFLDDSSLNLDNNDSERALRHGVIGRKNWMFAGSESGAHRTAAIYSLLYSCMINDIEPFNYLTDMLQRLINGRFTSYYDLTPKGWLENQLQQGNAPPPYKPDTS